MPKLIPALAPTSGTITPPPLSALRADALPPGANGAAPAVNTNPSVIATTSAAAIELSPADRAERRYIVGALMLVMVLASMEQTVTSTAMPTIIGDLKGLEHYSWVASIYLLASAVTMPLYGRLADALGRKRVIIVAIVLFCGASVLAAGARNIFQLILFRGLQGLGAGGIMPVVLTIAGDIFNVRERPRVQGFFSAVWGTAALAGPQLGAFLVRTLGWRSIFFVNLPFGLLGLWVLMVKYHDREKPHSTDLDLPGAGLLAVSSAAALAAASSLRLGTWNGPAAGALALICVIAGIFFFRHERRAANPILPLSLIVMPAIGPSLFASAILGVGFLSLDTYVPLYVQGAFGGGAQAAAAVVTPVMLTWASSGVLAAPAIVRLGFRKTAIIGCLLMTASFAGLLACALLGAPRWALTATLAVSGLGFGPASMAYLLCSQDAVAWQQRGIMTSGIMLFRTLGGAVGIGLLGQLFNVIIAGDLARLHGIGVTPDSLMDPRARAAISPDALRQASTMIACGLTWVFACMLGFAVLQTVTTFFMSSRKASHAITKAQALEALAG